MTLTYFNASSKAIVATSSRFRVKGHTQNNLLTQQLPEEVESCRRQQLININISFKEMTVMPRISRLLFIILDIEVEDIIPSPGTCFSNMITVMWIIFQKKEKCISPVNSVVGHRVSTQFQFLMRLCFNFSIIILCCAATAVGRNHKE